MGDKIILHEKAAGRPSNPAPFSAGPLFLDVFSSFLSSAKVCSSVYFFCEQLEFLAVVFLVVVVLLSLHTAFPSVRFRRFWFVLFPPPCPH